MASTGAAEAVRWLQIRCTRLETADGLPPLPMQVSWVRDGILVVGMDSEMHIYSQWRPQKGAPKGKHQFPMNVFIKLKPGKVSHKFYSFFCMNLTGLAVTLFFQWMTSVLEMNTYLKLFLKSAKLITALTLIPSRLFGTSCVEKYS